MEEKNTKVKMITAIFNGIAKIFKHINFKMRCCCESSCNEPREQTEIELETIPEETVLKWQDNTGEKIMVI